MKRNLTMIGASISEADLAEYFGPAEAAFLITKRTQEAEIARAFSGAEPANPIDPNWTVHPAPDPGPSLAERPPPKKYVVFAWDDYYPAGGLGDICGSF